MSHEYPGDVHNVGAKKFAQLVNLGFHDILHRSSIVWDTRIKRLTRVTWRCNWYELPTGGATRCAVLQWHRDSNTWILNH